MHKNKIIFSTFIIICATIGLLNPSEKKIEKVSQNVVEVQPIKANVVELSQLESQEIKTEVQKVKRESTNRGNVDRKMELPDVDSSMKTYMDYRTISYKPSEQYKLQQQAWTDHQGFRRYNEDYMIAIGTYYAEECSKRFKITLEDGIEFTAIVGDVKMPIHTDSTNRYVPINESIIEFIVDTRLLNKLSKSMGSMEYSGMSGKVVSIEVIE